MVNIIQIIKNFFYKFFSSNIKNFEEEDTNNTFENIIIDEKPKMQEVALMLFNSSRLSMEGDTKLFKTLYKRYNVLKYHINIVNAKGLSDLQQYKEIIVIVAYDNNFTKEEANIKLQKIKKLFTNYNEELKLDIEYPNFIVSKNNIDINITDNSTKLYQLFDEQIANDLYKQLNPLALNILLLISSQDKLLTINNINKEAILNVVKLCNLFLLRYGYDLNESSRKKLNNIFIKFKDELSDEQLNLIKFCEFMNKQYSNIIADSLRFELKSMIRYMKFNNSINLSFTIRLNLLIELKLLTYDEDILDIKKEKMIELLTLARKKLKKY